jgi:hypothetical protein
MTTIAEIGSFVAREQAAAAAVLLPSDDGKLARVTAASATVPNGTAGPR